MTTGSLLIEIGGHANTLDEALRAGEYAAKALAAVLGGLISHYNFNQGRDSSLPGSLRRRTLPRADMESAPTVGIGVPDAPQTFMASQT